jgi:Flp pilus assembly protein TadB
MFAAKGPPVRRKQHAPPEKRNARALVSADRKSNEPEIIPPERAPFEDERVRMSVRWRSYRYTAGQPNLFVKIVALVIAIVFAIVLFVLVGALVIWLVVGIAILYLVVYLAGLFRRRQR